ncbi:MAG: hypothetical protein Q8R69_13890 [Telluria sp.]|nr:hypothetical protein [Telluria sp.]
MVPLRVALRAAFFSNFVGNGTPSIIAQTLSYGPGAEPMKAGNLEMCRLMEDDTASGTATDDGALPIYG